MAAVAFADVDDYSILVEEPYSTLIIVVVIFVILTIIAVAVLLLYLYIIVGYVHNNIIGKQQIEPVDYEMEIVQLQNRKKELEEMIKIATHKFHRRKLDDQSFREIVRDQQGKLIEIEAKINDIEERMSKLEKIKKEH